MLKPRPIYCPNVILLDPGIFSEFPVGEAKAIVKKLTKNHKLISVYINNQIEGLDDYQVVVKSFDYAIYKETDNNKPYFTSQLLNAGSDYVYYLKTDDDESFRAAFIHIFDILGTDYPIVCISDQLSGQLQCGAVIMANSNKIKVEPIVQKGTPLLTTSQLLKSNITFQENKIRL